MRKQKFRWPVWLLSFVFMLVLVPVTHASAAPATSITVNGVNILTADNNTVACGDGTAVYDPENNTLTLENATIEPASDNGISAKGDLEIVLVGENTITAPSYGIYAGSGTLTISEGAEGGTLQINSGSDGISANSAVIDGVDLEIKAGNYYGIYTGGTLTIQNGAYVDATGTAEYGYGIYAGSDVSITGSVVHAQSTSPDAYGGLCSVGDLFISSASTVVVHTESAQYNAIVTDGTVTISGGSSVEATATGGNAVQCTQLTLTGSNTVLEAETDAASAVPVVYAYSGSITISGGAKYQSLNSAGYGLYAANSITVEDATLAITSSGNICIQASNSVTVEKSTLEITSSESYAIYGVSSLSVTGSILDIEGTNGLASEGKIILNGTDGSIEVNDLAIWSATYIELTDCDLELSGQNTVNASNPATGDIVINNSELDVTGTDAIYAKLNIAITDSQLTVDAALRPIAADSGTLTIDGETTDIQATGGMYMSGTGVYINSGNVNIHVTVPEDSDEELMCAIFAYTGGIHISGGTVNASIDGKDIPKYGIIARGPLSITGGIVTLSGDRAIFVTADGGSVDFGGGWFQYADSPLGTPTAGAGDPPYSQPYLRLEPIGTTYSLTAEGSEGSGSYPAGTEIPLSAVPYNDQQHFTGWTVTGADASEVLADSTAADTTLTMPAANITVTANYENHTMENFPAKAPTCTDAGWEAYEGCACGYAPNRVEIPANGHDPEAEWHYGESSHWRICSECGAVLSEAPHTYEWVVDREATATTAGSRHQECIICGYARSPVDIPATGTATGTTPGGGDSSAETPADPGTSTGGGTTTPDAGGTTTPDAGGTTTPDAGGTTAPDAGDEPVRVTAPETGDNGGVSLRIAVMAAGCAALTAVLYSRKKKHSR